LQWIGTIIASPGPSLLALSRQTGAPLDTIGFILTARAFMYLIGSLGGLLFDRYDAHRLIFASLCICTVGSLCVPLASSIYQLGATVGCQGLVVGFMDTGVNSLIFVLHEGDQVEPYMQTV
jgi:MFS family permease